uniref:Uncharacterized protein n=1 Tax=Meloidogyne hapla TaxID=6305 RepID=A0A1I8BBL3_MELHA
MNWKFILIYLIYYINISNSAHVPTILDNLTRQKSEQFIQKMETEFRNPLNVPIIFEFRIALISCIGEEHNNNNDSASIPLLNRIMRDAGRNKSVFDKGDNNLAETILSAIHHDTFLINLSSHQENYLIEIGLMEKIENLLRQIVPISKEKDLPSTEAEDKALQLMKIITDLENHLIKEFQNKFIIPVSNISNTKEINFITITNEALNKLKGNCVASTSSEPSNTKNFLINILKFYGYIYMKLAEIKEANDWIKKFAKDFDHEVEMQIFIENFEIKIEG